MINLPSTMSAFTVTTGHEYCFAWALGTDLVAPTATASQINGTLTTSTNHYITFD